MVVLQNFFPVLFFARRFWGYFFLVSEYRLLRVRERVAVLGSDGLLFCASRPPSLSARLVLSFVYCLFFPFSLFLSLSLLYRSFVFACILFFPIYGFLLFFFLVGFAGS